MAIMKTMIQNWYNRIRANEKTHIPYVILLLVLAGVFGSLYYSNYGDPIANLKLMQLFPVGAGLIPCRLCWYARILLYPMVVIAGVGIWKRDVSFINYIIPLAALGIPLTMYHYTIQQLPPSFNIGACDLYSPCNVAKIEYLGFITIPMMAFFSFVVILLLALRYRRLCQTEAN